MKTKIPEQLRAIEKQYVGKRVYITKAGHPYHNHMPIKTWPRVKPL